MPVDTPFPDPWILDEIARRFGLTAADAVPLPQGEANHVVHLGESLVLRVPRDDPDRIADLRKEADVIPVVRAAGVETPGLVAYDDGAALGVPFMVLERAGGVDLDRWPPGAAGIGQVYEAVGRQLARLHRIARSGTAGLITVPVDHGDRDDPRHLLGPLVTEGLLDPATGAWLDGWFVELAALRSPEPLRVLIHGDIAPRNLLADPATGRLTALVDWGDAAWADPAMDLAKLPLGQLDAVLTGYLPDERHDGARSVWRARALHYHLHWAVAAIGRRDPATAQPLATGAAVARLLAVLRAVIDTLDQGWRSPR